MEWKMEWNDERTQLHLTHLTGAAQTRLKYLVYSAEALRARLIGIAQMFLYPCMVYT